MLGGPDDDGDGLMDFGYGMQVIANETGTAAGPIVMQAGPDPMGAPGAEDAWDWFSPRQSDGGYSIRTFSFGCDPNFPDPNSPEFGPIAQVHLRLYSPAEPGTEPCGGNPECSTDINGDCPIDNVELQAVLESWAMTNGDPGFDARVDYDDSGAIDNVDLQALLDTWANECPP
jgi:hypothetical protein